MVMCGIHCPLVVRVRFSRIHDARHGFQYSALVQRKGDVAPEMDRTGGIHARRGEYRSAAGGVTGADGLVESRQEGKRMLYKVTNPGITEFLIKGGELAKIIKDKEGECE